MENDSLKEIFETVNKKGYENIKNNLDDIKESVNKLLDEACCFMAVSNNGMYVQGNKPLILSCISSITQSLLKNNNNITKEDIIEAVELGAKDKSELRNKSKEKLEEILEMLKDM